MGQLNDDIKYNINGIGTIESNFFKHAKNLMEYKELEIPERLQKIKLLGSISCIHKGANFTRYEYILLQINLLKIVADMSSIGLNSTFNNKFYRGNDELRKYFSEMTRGECIQIMIILGNMGHFYGTHSSNKVWFNILKNNYNGIKSSFKKGLKGKSKNLLDRIINEGHVNKLHWITTLYILSRKSKYIRYRELGEIILENLIDQSDDKTFDIYNKIRKVSYVVLDSHFSPIPVILSFQHMVFDKKAFVDELLKYKSSLLDTVDKMNDLLETTLYAENNVLLSACLNNRTLHKKITEKLSEDYVININFISDLLINRDSILYKDNMDSEFKWDKNINLSISYKFKEKSNIPIDTIELELNAYNKMRNACFIAYSNSPDSLRFRTVYALSNTRDKYELPTKLKEVIKLACNDYLKYRDHSYKEIDNGYLEDVVIKKIFTYFFRNILNEDYFCEYNDLGLSSAYLMVRGSKNAATRIESIIDESNLKNKDVKHELYAVKECLRRINYKGIILVCLGSLRFMDDKKKTICELDGVILIPREKGDFLYIIEAKNKYNKSKRFTDASKQLSNNLEELFKNLNVTTKIDEINGYGAVFKMRSNKWRSYDLL